MDVLFYVLCGVGFVLWVVWTWGKNSVEEKGKKEMRELKDYHERKIDKLEETIGKQKIEIAAVQAELREVRIHCDTLRGRAGPILIEIQRSRPSWILSDGPFLLLAPGKMRSLAQWARSARDLWTQVERLSPQSRRAMEEATNTHFDSCTKGNVLDLPDISMTPLFREVVGVIESRPEGLNPNFFELNSDKLEELVVWFDYLVDFSVSYAVEMAYLDEETRNRILSATKIAEKE